MLLISQLPLPGNRFEFPLELNMYKYTKAAADAREAAEAAAEGPGPCPAAEAAEGAASADCHYELRGIVVHSGTANAGHYYSYIKVLPAALTGFHRMRSMHCIWACMLQLERCRRQL